MSLLDELEDRFGLASSDLKRIIASAPARYKVYQIPKRRGGVRTIAQPSRDLKAMQRFVMDTKFAPLPVHQAARGYVSGASILNNAEPHRHNQVILKLDFKDFFPSILVRDWLHFLKSKEVCEPLRPDSALYSHILFWGKSRRSKTPTCLSIGAPSSPMLSNILLHDLDVKFALAASELTLAYTRYADDITVSGAALENIRKFEIAARRIVKATKSPKLGFNDEKCGIYLRGQRRMVTGLVITPTEDISIGRERKRLISAMLHHVSIVMQTLVRWAA
jgi:hypothetical protein